MTTKDDLGKRADRFVNYLMQLTRREAQGDSGARAALAELRSGLRGTPRDLYRMGKHVVPYLGERAHQADGWFYLVGALFASHPVHEQGPSFGASFRRFKDDSSSDSVDGRFLALLSCRAADLPDHLRHAVSLLRAKNVAVDYRRLLLDILAWDIPDRPRQRQWARDFYRFPNTPDAASEDETNTDTLENGDTHES